MGHGGQKTQHGEGLLVEIPLGDPQGLVAAAFGSLGILLQLPAVVDAVVEHDPLPGHSLASLFLSSAAGVELEQDAVGVVNVEAGQLSPGH